MKKPKNLKNKGAASIPVMLSTILLYSCTAIKKMDVEFAEKPCLIPEQNYSFTLCQSYKFKVNHKEYSIPKGFHTDLVSVPWMFWWRIYPPTHDTFLIPSLAHDWIYSCDTEMSREDADAMLYNGLIKNHVNERWARAYYWGNRLVGWQHFKKQGNGNTCAGITN